MFFIIAAMGFEVMVTLNSRLNTYLCIHLDSVDRSMHTAHREAQAVMGGLKEGSREKTKGIGALGQTAPRRR